MSILIKSAYEPQNGAAVLNEALGRLYHPAETRSSLRQFKPGATKSGLYHDVYELAADTVAAGGRLNQAKRSGSRYLLAAENGVHAAIELETDPLGTTGTFKSINDGPFVAGTEQAIALAEALPDNESYEFSLVRVSALKLWVLWLKPVDALQAARFHVIAPAPIGFDTTRPYTEDGLFAILTPAAQALFKFNPAAGPDTGDLVG
jgi:hypothetical protein